MIIENKVKSVDSFNKEGEHKIEGVPNLYLRVGKSNKVFRYKSKKWLTLGQYGIDTTLRDAEMLSKIISVKLKQGFNVDQIDSTLTITKSPYHFEDQLKQVADIKVNNPKDIPTFKDVHREWHKFKQFKEKWSKGYIQHTMNVPTNYAHPFIGDKQIHAITRKQVSECVNNVYLQGKDETARKLRGQLEDIFDYAIDNEWLDNNPVPQAKSALIIGKKTRAVGHGFLKFEKIPEIVQILMSKNTPQSLATVMALITSKRVKEVCKMKWKDIHFKEKQWNAPSETTKSGRPHNIPITVEFMGILEHMLAGTTTEYVFRSKDSHISLEAPRYQLRRIILKNMKEFKHIDSEREPDAHGFRTSFGTWARQAGYDIKYIKAQQSHADDGSVTEMYNRYDWIQERRVMAQHWEDFCFSKCSFEEKSRL